VASEALGSLSNQFDVSTNLQKWLGNLQGKVNFIVRRGWATALGHIRTSEYPEILSSLGDSIESDGDVEVKRNAINSVRMIFSRISDFHGTSYFR
jgi:hypothetical protein